MSAFSVLPLAWRLTIIAGVPAVLAGAAGIIHHEIYQSGYDAAIADVRAANKEAIDAATLARKLVDDCYAHGGVWSQAAGKCQ